MFIARLTEERQYALQTEWGRWEERCKERQIRFEKESEKKLLVRKNRWTWRNVVLHTETGCTGDRKSTSEFNKIVAKISLKGGVREIWGVHLGELCCWQLQDFTALDGQGGLTGHGTDTECGDRQTWWEVPGRFTGVVHRSLDRGEESISSTLSDRLTGSGLKWRRRVQSSVLF